MALPFLPPSFLPADELMMLTALRRDLHAHPELGFEEERTSEIVAQKLAEAGIAVHRGLGKTGVVGTLTMGNGTGRIALRADMDALPMPELTGLPYASRSPGKMHACGHDGHTVTLLAAARHLAREGKFNGTVHFIFQPAEEGVGGARAMLADGFLGKFPLDRVYGLHNMPGMEPDEIAVVEGPQLASSDRWTVRFSGTGTHGAKPHLGREPITALGAFLGALHTIVARVVDPLEPAVVSACALSAGDLAALNVIPDRAVVGGTSRAYSPVVRDQLELELRRIATGIAATYGLSAEVDYIRGVPPVINAPEPTAIAAEAAALAFGTGLRRAFPPSTAGDDFAVFSQEVPGCYVWLGNGPAVDGALHHNSRYDFNDAAIETGARFWATLVETDLKP